MKVVVVLQQYPQLSESYINVELRELARHHDVSVLAFKEGPDKVGEHLPYEILKSTPREIVSQVKALRPDVLHAHWLTGMIIDVLHGVGTALSVPFTIRSHSFDILGRELSWTNRIAKLNSDLCIGLIGFPFARSILTARGVMEDKLVDAPPCVEISRFYDESPNGSAVLATGACLPKKKFEDFIRLAAKSPRSTAFNLYAIGYHLDRIRALNARAGTPVNICYAVEHEQMSSVYKRHRWLVYTADPRENTVGWPTAIAEAQAAGVGVCIANIRDDLRQYTGGAAIHFDDVAELVDIVSRPVPEEMRETAFANALSLDISRQIHKLTDRWTTRPRAPSPSADPAAAPGLVAGSGPAAS